MRKFITILLLSMYSLGNILLPSGDRACLHELYGHCAAEDPDINLADFVFEHLLNVPDVFDLFEQEDKEQNEKPHQPFHDIASSIQLVVIEAGKPIKFECRPFIASEQKTKYSVQNSSTLVTGFLSEIFRPPAV